MTEVVAPALPPRKFKVHNYIDSAKLKADIAYSVADLSNAQSEQAARYVEYVELQAKASFQVDDLELLLEAAESKVYRKLRDDAVDRAEKVTEAQLEKAVAIHDTIRAIKKAINEAKQIETIAKGAVKAFEQRKDMLVQTGATERKQLEGEVRTMIRDRNESEVDILKRRFLDNAAAKKA